MTTWAALVFFTVFYTNLVQGEYGAKLKANTTESLETSRSSEDMYDYISEEEATTAMEKEIKMEKLLDDGVIIEKAILAAEIHTPGSHYNLEDSSEEIENSLNGAYSQALVASRGSQRYFGFSEAGDSDLAEYGNRFIPSISSSTSTSTSSMTTSSTTNSPYRYLSRSSNLRRIHNQEISNRRSLGRSSFEASSTKPDEEVPSVQPRGRGRSTERVTPSSPVSQKPYSATYKNTKDVVAVTTYRPKISPSNVHGLFFDISRNSLGNSDDSPLEPQSTNQQSWNSLRPIVVNPLPTTETPVEDIVQTDEDFEQERLNQIEATKSYIKQVEEAQEYAQKIQELTNAVQNSLQSFSQPQKTNWEESGTGDAYLPPEGPSSQRFPPISAVVSRTQAPGEANFGYQSPSSWPKQDFTTQETLPTPHQVNSLATGGWPGYPSFSQTPSSGPTDSPPELIWKPYSGPTASPVVLPSGFLADTEEVTRAKIAHLQAIMKAIETASLWKDPEPDQWS